MVRSITAQSKLVIIAITTDITVAIFKLTATYRRIVT